MKETNSYYAWNVDSHLRKYLQIQTQIFTPSVVSIKRLKKVDVE